MVIARHDDIYAVLSTVFDPEVPVLNVVEMGIVRSVKTLDDGSTEVVIVPTYTGCPAMNAIESLVRKALDNSGYGDVRVVTHLHVAWTTEWMTREAREKLRAYGIAPPDEQNQSGENIPCPFCGSTNTRLQSFFGSTACKSMHFCDGCVQPFEHFKCH